MTKQAINQKVNMLQGFVKSCFVLCLLFFSYSKVSSQLYSNKPFFVGVSGYFGKFQVHTPKLQYYNGSHPYGFEIEAGEWLISKKVKERYGIYAKWGMNVNYVNFGHEDLGYGIGSLVFIEPFFKARGNLRFSSSFEAGVSYMSKPYHSVDNPINQTYSTNIAFPLIARFRCYYFFNNQMAIKASVSFRHVSNGGLREPNLGINYPTLGIGFERVFNNYKVVPLNTINNYSYKKKGIEILGGYSVKVDSLERRTGNVVTLYANRSLQVSKYNAITFGGLMEYQESDEKAFVEQCSVGASIGNEFVVGKVKFGQQLGIYVYKRQNAPTLLFQNYYLRYLAGKKILIGVGLKAHGIVADYLNFQLGYVLK